MKKLLPLLLALPLFAACASNVNNSGAEPASPPTGAAPLRSTAALAKTITDKRVIVDPDLGAAARLLSIVKSGPEQPYLRVEVNIQNQTESAQSFFYQFDWTDAFGNSLNMETPIIPITLMAHEPTGVVAISPSPLPRNFCVYFFPTTVR